METSDSTNTPQCQETSVLQAEIQKVEVKRSVRGYLVALFGFISKIIPDSIAYTRSIDMSFTDFLIRPCLRRQSTKFKLEEPVAIKDSLEIENSNSTSTAFPCKETKCEVVPTSSVGKEDYDNSIDISEVQECRRTSVGRPSRRAAEKVISYKEIPLNVKMRRQV